MNSRLSLVKKINGKSLGRDLLTANLIRLRAERGFSQEHLADLAKLHRTAVSKIERTLTNVSIDNIQKLADGLQVHISELFREVQ